MPSTCRSDIEKRFPLGGARMRAETRLALFSLRRACGHRFNDVYIVLAAT